LVISSINSNEMASLIVTKNNEKILIWMQRAGKNINWLAKFLNVTRQKASQKLKENDFQEFEVIQIKNELK